MTEEVSMTPEEARASVKRIDAYMAARAAYDAVATDAHAAFFAELARINEEYPE